MIPTNANLARMGEIKCGTSGEVVGCHGLGSCIALFAYDPRLQIGWVAHVVLPDGEGRPIEDLPGRYMDRAFESLFRLMQENNVSPQRVKLVAVGGANVFKFGNGGANLNLEIGARNINALREHLAKHRLRLTGEKLGGDKAASTYLCVETGELFVATNTREFELLCNLKEVYFVNAAA